MFASLFYYGQEESQRRSPRDRRRQRSEGSDDEERHNRSRKRTEPVFSERRVQSLDTLYTYQDYVRETIRQCMIKRGVHHPPIPALIVEYMPLYSWSPPKRHQLSEEKEQDFMRVSLTHNDTVACNAYLKFGAVMGSYLDPNMDHVINFRLEEGIEFGVGICDESQKFKGTKRDFMCMPGGYGYYNYKTKSPRLKPKYPPGLYYQTNTCQKQRPEEDICKKGDVLTIVIQRENIIGPVPGGGLSRRKRFSSRMGPLGRSRARSGGRLSKDTPKPAGLGRSKTFSLSYYKNGEDMGFHLRNLRGPFYLCLNYYFVESTVRILSDYRFFAARSQVVRRRRESQKQLRSMKEQRRS